MVVFTVSHSHGNQKKKSIWGFVRKLKVRRSEIVLKHGLSILNDPRKRSALGPDGVNFTLIVEAQYEQVAIAAMDCQSLGVAQIAVDIDYHHNMLAAHLKVNLKETIVGWYSTGVGVNGGSAHGGSALIHDFYAREATNPIHLTVDTRFTNGESTIKAFVSSNLSLGDQQLAAQFQEILGDLRMVDAERVGCSCIEFEDVEGDDEMAVDYPCPFCSDDYELVELCHHIDEEHQLDANNGICPVCSRRVKMHMVDHITTQHRDVLKLEQKQDESYSGFSPGTKKYLQSLMDESLSKNHTSKTVPDSLLSFVCNLSSPNQPKLLLPYLSREANMEDKTSISHSIEQDGKSLSPLSDTELLEKAKKTEFVQGLISSTIFDHIDNF